MSFVLSTVGITFQEKHHILHIWIEPVIDNMVGSLSYWTPRPTFLTNFFN